MSSLRQYTAVSFAPVQGFIEKSRKLRDLFGSSLILSYLSQQVAQAAQRLPEVEVISPALINVQEGMPNRILIRGLFERNDVENTLFAAWAKILQICRDWIEQNVPVGTYHWDQEWLRWKQYTWEVFWGQGNSPEAAMLDLERRKLKRDWTGINWTGESSSLTGTDAIAWHRLGEQNSHPGRSLSSAEKVELAEFYRQLAWVLDDPYQRAGQLVPKDVEPEGKYIAANERLSIPELVKRLVTLPRIAKQLDMDSLGEGFKDIVREPGYWTGWFMGDGDKVGEKLKKLSSDQERSQFSNAMRAWGKTFKAGFPSALGRVIYAGGDDFLGVLYSDVSTQKLNSGRALKWLLELPAEWQQHGQDITVSTGFIWAGHQVPQRDILQHCREAEKRAKSLGRNRVTIRVVFNSGQHVQWTCPWKWLFILEEYQDREGGQNWAHVYSDWAHLKARHAIRFEDVGRNLVDADLGISVLDFYFNNIGSTIRQEGKWVEVAGSDTDSAILQWIDELIQVGWQLCSNI